MVPAHAHRGPHSQWPCRTGTTETTHTTIMPKKKGKSPKQLNKQQAQLEAKQASQDRRKRLEAMPKKLMGSYSDKELRNLSEGRCLLTSEAGQPYVCEAGHLTYVAPSACEVFKKALRSLDMSKRPLELTLHEDPKCRISVKRMHTGDSNFIKGTVPKLLEKYAPCVHCLELDGLNQSALKAKEVKQEIMQREQREKAAWRQVKPAKPVKAKPALVTNSYQNCEHFKNYGWCKFGRNCNSSHNGRAPKDEDMVERCMWGDNCGVLRGRQCSSGCPNMRKVEEAEVQQQNKVQELEKKLKQEKWINQDLGKKCEDLQSKILDLQKKLKESQAQLEQKRDEDDDPLKKLLSSLSTKAFCYAKAYYDTLLEEGYTGVDELKDEGQELQEVLQDLGWKRPHARRLKKVIILPPPGFSRPFLNPEDSPTFNLSPNLMQEPFKIIHD